MPVGLRPLPSPLFPGHRVVRVGAIVVVGAAGTLVTASRSTAVCSASMVASVVLAIVADLISTAVATLLLRLLVRIVCRALSAAIQERVEARLASSHAFVPH